MASINYSVGIITLLSLKWSLQDIMEAWSNTTANCKNIARL